MELERLLGQLVSKRGVRGAAMITSDGGLVAQTAAPGDEQPFGLETMVAALASGRALASLLDEGSIRQLTVEFDSGTLLLMPIGAARGEFAAVLALTGNDVVGRVQFELRSLLPDLERELGA